MNYWRPQLNFPKVTLLTYKDLGLWLTEPNNYNNAQLKRLQDEDLCLPLISLAHRYHLIAPLMCQLRGSEAWGQLPEGLQCYLTDVADVFMERAKNLVTETIYVCKLLTNSDIDVTVMKGAACLFNGVADPISNRYMKDIDLLVPEHQQKSAEALLKNNSYEPDPLYFDVYENELAHAPPLKRNEICFVELHRWLIPKRLHKVLDTEEAWKEVKPLQLEAGLCVRQLAPTHQVILSIIHSELVNSDYDQSHIDLHQLFHLVSVVKFYQKQINWIQVEEHFQLYDLNLILKSVLYAAYDIFGLDTPITELNDIRARKHVKKCVNKYVKNQGQQSRIDILMEQLDCYKPRNIYLKYNDGGRFSYCKGIFKEVYYHYKKIVCSEHLKPYLKRLFS